jgi:acyl carrier protein
MAETSQELRKRIKEVIVEDLMLSQDPAEIADDAPIFGPDGLAADSVDALQLVVALEKNFGLRLPDAATARETLVDIESVAKAVEAKRRQA